MGGKSVSHRATQHKQRQKMRYQSMKNLMEGRAEVERTPPSRDENKCQKCGFKATYKFIRCPSCDEVQK